MPAFASGSQTFKERFRAKKLTLHPAGHGLSDLRQGVRTPLFVLMAMVGLVLLIACANVANLLLSRATARQKEIAVRLALGAGRSRLIRQTLTESLVLAAAGGIVGLVLSIWVGDLLLERDAVRELHAIALDRRPICASGCSRPRSRSPPPSVFGLIPALQASKPELNRTLREEAGIALGRDASRALPQGTGRRAGGALDAARRRRRALRAQPLQPEDARHGLHGRQSDDVPRRSGAQRLRPGSRSSASTIGCSRTFGAFPACSRPRIAQVAALTGSASSRTIQVQGYEPKPDENMNPWTNEIAPDYFRTMGMPLVMGREFNERDVAGAPLVAIVNESFANYFWPNQNRDRPPLRLPRHEQPGRDRDRRRRQGLALRRHASGNDARRTKRRASSTRRTSRARELNEMTVYVRTAGAGADAMPEQLRQAVRRADAAMPVFEMQSMEQTVDEALFNERMLALLSASFGLLATVLAAIGLYGVMSYTVSRRTREIGIRIALGAERVTVVWLVLREVAFLTIVGIGVGVPGALGLSRLVRSQLFGIEPTDPLTLDDRRHRARHRRPARRLHSRPPRRRRAAGAGAEIRIDSVASPRSPVSTVSGPAVTIALNRLQCLHRGPWAVDRRPYNGAMRFLLVAALSRWCPPCPTLKPPLPLLAFRSKSPTARAARISDLRYDLSLTVPEATSAPIAGTNAISFELTRPRIRWSSTSRPAAST